MSGIKRNAIVGQSGGPTAVINNSLVGVIHEAVEQEGIGEIYGMLRGIKGVIDEDLVDLCRESPQTLEMLRDTPSSALGTVRYKVTDADYDRILEILKAHDIGYFLYIGGNDSMDTAHKVNLLAQREGYDLQVIGVPKTIDNDLAMTDHCPGYGSAARFVATAIRGSGWDTIAMGESSPIKLMEIMGRNAGWLTAATALAKEYPEDPPQLIYVPERGVSLEKLIDDVRYWYHRLGYCVLAASEGLRDETGQPMGASRGKAEVDAFGHSHKVGVIEFLDELVKDSLGVNTRHDKPGYLQRSFTALVSPVDREEAYEVGCAAVRAAVAGETDKMVTLVRRAGPEYAISMGLAPLAEVANAEHLLSPEYLNKEGNGMTQAFLDYARPLIGDPLPPYARLAKYAVEKRLGPWLG